MPVCFWLKSRIVSGKLWAGLILQMQQLLLLRLVHYPLIVVNIHLHLSWHECIFQSLVKWLVRDLLHIVSDEVLQNLSCLRISLTNLKLNTTRILVYCKHWTSVWICQNFIVMLSKIEVCGFNWVWVPFISGFHYELSRDALKNVVALVKPRNIAFHRFLVYLSVANDGNIMFYDLFSF